ncbi:MAG: ABC transporter permease [Verrucomicrobia bacterium]|nr:ABC transporter permease [Verrucomicrobiota bacterium]
MWNRLKALIRKETLVVLRDPRNRVALIAPPLLQLFLFSFTGTQEVKSIRLAILNQDYGQPASELVQRLSASPNFTNVEFVQSPGQLRRLIDAQRVILGVQVPADFSKRFYTNDYPVIQVILDGRKSMAGQIAQGYLATIVVQFSQDQGRAVTTEGNGVLVKPRNWFNPNLDYLWFTVPSLVVIITLQVSMNVTTMSVPREREMGTFEQLLVSPLRPVEIMIGKAIPAFFLALFDGTLFVLVAIFVFQIPFKGSLPWLYLSVIVFVTSVVGIGLLISTICETQQQALLATMAVLMPALILSGYTSPIENMPGWLQAVTLVNPLRYMMIIVKGIFLKGIPTDVVIANVWPMAAIAGGTLSLAAVFFRRRVAW